MRSDAQSDDTTAQQSGRVRKHLFLVTEHEEDDRVGGVSVFDKPTMRPEKNEEAPITRFNEDKTDFIDVGMKVGLGYHDFESEQDFEERAADVMQMKIREVDRKWAEKAGVEELVYDE
jgi:hypothetical protein